MVPECRAVIRALSGIPRVASAARLESISKDDWIRASEWFGCRCFRVFDVEFRIRA